MTEKHLDWKFQRSNPHPNADNRKFGAHKSRLRLIEQESVVELVRMLHCKWRYPTFPIHSQHQRCILRPSAGIRKSEVHKFQLQLQVPESLAESFRIPEGKLKAPRLPID